ncbi:cobalt transporter CbiM [Azospirillum sp. ST 5-10]|uniref:cobalt transporter CbiM n=1 Tax=unclassified Azospirillum TaxID=2630922 RepID=UPI003F4A7274
MAHIPDGVLSVPVLVAGAAVAAAGCAYGLKRLEPEAIPRVGVLASMFFVASLVHFPVGPTSVHLILNGLTGVALGWAAFPAILVALLLQAVLFGFGGLTSLGVNVAIMAVPAVACGAMVGAVRRLSGNDPRWTVAAAGGAGAFGVLGTALAVALVLALSGREFVPAARLAVLAHLPVMAIEAFFTAAAVALVLRVKPGILAAAALALAVLGSGNDAQAHKLKIFAAAEGAAVSGYAYFDAGTRAQDARVTAITPDGAVAFEGRTDARGSFRFEAQRRLDHRLAVDAGDGHQAWFTVRAAELPEGLPSGAAAGGAPPPATAAPAAAAAAGTPAGEDLAALIERSVARQVRPLREDLDADREAVRLHDVLGGIGYIVGLAGLAYGLANRSRRLPEDRR